MQSAGCIWGIRIALPTTVNLPHLPVAARGIWMTQEDDPIGVCTPCEVPIIQATAWSGCQGAWELSLKCTMIAAFKITLSIWQLGRGLRQKPLHRFQYYPFPTQLDVSAIGVQWFECQLSEEKMIPAPDQARWGKTRCSQVIQHCWLTGWGVAMQRAILARCAWLK